MFVYIIDCKAGRSPAEVFRTYKCEEIDMKKFLVVMMIAMVSMTGLFATPETNTLNLTYGVDELFVPDYTMTYKVYAAAYSALQASGTTSGFNSLAQGNTTIAVAANQDDFAAGYVEVVVNDNTKYNLKTAKTVTYATAVTQSWKQTVSGNTYDGPEVTLVDFQVPSSPSDITIDDSATNSFTVTYPTYTVHNTAAVQELGRFAAKWAADPTVEAGTYTAIVTLTVTAD